MHIYPRKKHLIFLLIINSLHHTVFSQIGYQIVSGARSQSMAGASVAFQDINAIFNNPAGLMGIKQTSSTITSEMRFGVKDLKPIGIATVVPTNSSVFGFSFQNFSFDIFQENKVGVAYARSLSKKINIGFQFDYIHLRLGEYGTRSMLTFEVGCNTVLNKNIIISAYMFNPIAVSLNEKQRIPSVFRLGMAYNINSVVLLCFETEANNDWTPSLKFGLEYKIVEKMAVRCGFKTLYNIFSFGFGYALNHHLTMDLALSNHLNLGATPSLNLNYFFGNERK